MAKAIWKGQVIAESEETHVVENQTYFPPDKVKKEFLKASTSTSYCPKRGQAHYYDVVVGDKVNEGAAWYYPDCKGEYEKIRGWIAFWNGVEVKE